jgi:hypothetical protein
MDPTQRDQIETATEGFAAQLGMPYFDTRQTIDIKPLVGKLTLVGMQAYGIVPVKLEGNHITIGTSEETDRAQLESLRHRMAGYTVDFVFISQFGWNRLFNRFSVAGNENILESGDFSRINQELLNVEPKFMFEPLAQLAYQLGVRFADESRC